MRYAIIVVTRESGKTLLLSSKEGQAKDGGHGAFMRCLAIWEKESGKSAQYADLSTCDAFIDARLPRYLGKRVLEWFKATRMNFIRIAL